VKDLKLELNDKININIVPWYFYDETSTQQDIEVSTYLYALNFETHVSEEELTNEELLNQCIKIANDLLFLFSFLSNSWIVWFSYLFSTKAYFKYFIKHSRETKKIKIFPSEIPISWQSITSFILSCFPNLERLRNDKLDLTVPITYYLLGDIEEYTEAKFMTTFQALEKIKDLYSKRKGVNKNLNSTDFNKLKEKLSSIISEELSQVGSKSKIPIDISIEIKKKLPELNRPALRTIIDRIFSEFHIKWEDLYPPGYDFTLIKTRDILVHSSELLDPHYLIKEYIRLRILISRIIIKMLGWNDLSHTLNDNDVRFLTNDPQN